MLTCKSPREAISDEVKASRRRESFLSRAVVVHSLGVGLAAVDARQSRAHVENAHFGEDSFQVHSERVQDSMDRAPLHPASLVMLVILAVKRRRRVRLAVAYLVLFS